VILAAEWRETALCDTDVNISIDNPVAVVDKTLINTVPEFGVYRFSFSLQLPNEIC